MRAPRERAAMTRAAHHRHAVRVYYEDTDLAGIVYYANYLRFIERARTEMLRAAGLDQTELKARHGIVFAVTRIEAEYRRPARFDDLLDVVTVPLRLSGARVTLRQEVWRGDDRLFSAQVTLAALTASGQPTRLPAPLRAALAAAPPDAPA